MSTRSQHVPPKGRGFSTSQKVVGAPEQSWDKRREYFIFVAYILHMYFPFVMLELFPMCMWRVGGLNKRHKVSLITLSSSNGGISSEILQGSVLCLMINIFAVIWK